MPFRASRRSERSRRGPAPDGAIGCLYDAVARSGLAFGREVKAWLLQDLEQGVPVEAQGSPVAARDDPHFQLGGSAGDVRVGRGHDGRDRCRAPLIAQDQHDDPDGESWWSFSRETQPVYVMGSVGNQNAP
jgi:hypothetical protein